MYLGPRFYEYGSFIGFCPRIFLSSACLHLSVVYRVCSEVISCIHIILKILYTLTLLSCSIVFL